MKVDSLAGWLQALDADPFPLQETMTHRSISFFVLLPTALLAGCRTLRSEDPLLHASLATASTVITAHHRGIAYTADIGFTFTNTTARPISRAGCGGLGLPSLEKSVNGRWVSAYSEISIACRTVPDFWLEPGSQIKEVLKFLAFERGHNTEPELLVESIDGIYRLRWGFVEGRIADAKGARRVEAVSNEFRMALQPSAPRASNTR